MTQSGITIRNVFILLGLFGSLATVSCTVISAKVRAEAESAVPFKTLLEKAEEYEGRALICKVDVEHVPDLAQRYGIQGIPAVVFFSEGKEVERLVRLQPRKAYTDVLDRLTG